MWSLSFFFSLFEFVQSLTRLNSRVAALTEPSLTAAGGGRREGVGLCSGRQMPRGFTPRKQMSGTTKESLVRVQLGEPKRKEYQKVLFLFWLYIPKRLSPQQLRLTDACYTD